MAVTRPVAKVFGIPVFLPANSIIGLVLVAWFAIPTSADALGNTTQEWLILIVALLHAVMLYASVFVHELGHAISARRFGYQVQGVSLTVIGGHTQIAAEYRRPRDQFWVALAGPFATLLVGLAAWGGNHITTGVLHSMLVWLAWSSVLIGVVNLLPGVPLDGGAAVDAFVWHRTHNRWRGRQVASATGFVVAALWASTPWLLAALFSRPVELSDILVSGLVGLWMASVSWRTYVYSTAKLSGKIPDSEQVEDLASQPVEPSATVHIRPFVRRAVEVEANQSIADALEIAGVHKAGAIIVTRDDVVVGIVRDAAIAATPDDLRRLTPIVQAARRVGLDEAIAADSLLTEIASDMNNPAVHEWLVVDSTGGLFGVLVKSDIWGRLDV